MRKVKTPAAEMAWRCFIAILLLAISLVVLVPLLNLLALSLSDPGRVSEVRGLTVIPKGFSLINYRVLAANPLFVRSILNSIYITVVGTALNLLVTSMAAFALTRPKLPLKRLFQALFVFVMIFEPGLIPEYWLSKKSVSWAPLGVILYKTVNVYYLIK